MPNTHAFSPVASAWLLAAYAFIRSMFVAQCGDQKVIPALLGANPRSHPLGSRDRRTEDC